MKLYKRSLLLIVMLVAAVVFWGCETVDTEETEETLTAALETAPTVDPIKAAYKADPTGYVVFYKSTEPRYTYVTVQEIVEYQTKYPDCNGTWFRDTLSGEDLCIYNSYLYAMENRYISFEMYVEDNDKDFDHIREALSMDSPLMEQNFNQYGEHVWKQPTNYLGERLSVSVEQFTGTRWDMKMEALDACRKIVEGIPEECITQEEKMQYLYRYVCDHVEYVSYENQADEDYLYDAVCKGKTVCDGYSNMLNLLFNLIGVECCEVIGRDYEDISQATPEQLKSGHTWVAAVLDGVYYNFDPTFEDTNDDSMEGALAYFGFSDDAVSKSYLSLEETRPKCTDNSRDFPFADLVVDNCTEDSQIRKIAELTEQRAKTGEFTTLVAVRQRVTQEQYKVMIDRFGYYSDDIGYIETSYIDKRNSTLMRLTVSLR